MEDAAPRWAALSTGAAGPAPVARSPGTHGRASYGLAPDRLDDPPATRGRCLDRLPPPARPSRPPVWGYV